MKTEAPLDLVLIAFNVRCLRMAHAQTQAELATVAGVDKATVHRLECGHRVHRRSLEKICGGLGESVDFVNSVLPYGLPEDRRKLFIHRQAENNWFASGDRRTRIPADSQARVQQPEERLRLGRQGLVRSFQAYMVVMPNSPGTSQFEIFERSWVSPNPTYEDAILLILRGEVIFRAADQVVLLGLGDSIGYSTDEEATVEPVHAIGPSDLPPLLLAITANRRGHVPIEFKDRKRMRTRHAAPRPAD